MRSLLNHVYALLVEGLDEDGRAALNRALDPPDPAIERLATVHRLVAAGIGEIG